MRNCTLFLVLFIFNFFPIQAQVVNYEPAFPTASDSLRVILDATKGNAGLAGFDGEVYLHTGVITNKSTSGSDWKYVKYNWETNNPEMKATPLGGDKWAFTYHPNIRDFFDVPVDEDILEVAIVYKGIKNNQVVAEGKDAGNSDIFIELLDDVANARFLNPSGEFEILISGESIDLSGVGFVVSGDLQLILEKGDTELASTTDDTLRYTFTPEAGEKDIMFHLIATNNEDMSDTASVFITVKENDGALISRPDGLEDGITENASSVTLSLFAPNKGFVYVVGNFNNWIPSSEFLMNKEISGDDSTWFWLEVEGITAGEDVLFQYLVDGETKIADPYSELVLDPWNDSYISEQTFANIPEYPSVNTDGLVSWIRFGQNEYEWQITEYERPAKEELVIYELLLRDFLAESNYSTLIDTLDYLENLGINAIELMPINEFDGNLSWGYNPALHLALDKYYGTPEDFKRFVDEAHSRGIAVIVDLVLNHATDLNPLYKLYKFGENPYFNTEARHAYNVFNDFNHQYSGTQYYVKRTVQYWIEEYNIDGFRWDLTKGFTQNCTSGNEACTGSKQNDRVEVLQKYADYQWVADSSFHVIFEHLGSETEEKEWANYRIEEGKGILLWGNMNYAYNEATMGYNNNSDLTGVLSESRPSFVDRHLIGYMESHDEERLMYKNLQYGASSGDYDTSELDIALNRMQLAAAFFLPLPGPKMIWQFGELGYDINIDFNGRTGEKPIRWDYLQDENRRKLYKTYQALLKLRHSSEAFTSPEVIENKLSGSLKWVKIQHEDSDVVLMGNFGLSSMDTSITFTTTGNWYDYFEGSLTEISEVNHPIHLEPGEFKIFTTKQFEQPEEGILTTMESGNAEQPGNFRLHQNYPNPFNPSTVISYQLVVSSNVKLQVFDVTGRQIATLVEGKQNAGEHQVVFEAGNLASGIYLTRLQAGNKVFIQKMTLIK